jgi:hypothetical protein
MAKSLEACGFSKEYCDIFVDNEVGARVASDFDGALRSCVAEIRVVRKIACVSTVLASLDRSGEFFNDDKG